MRKRYRFQFTSGYYEVSMEWADIESALEKRRKWLTIGDETSGLSTTINLDRVDRIVELPATKENP